MSRLNADLDTDVRRLQDRLAALAVDAANHGRDRQHLQLLMELLPLGIWTVDASLTITSAAGRAWDVLEQPAESIAGKNLRKLLPADDPRLLACERALSGHSYEATIVTAHRTYSLRTVPLPSEGKSAAFAVALECGEARSMHPATARPMLFENADDLLLTLDLQGRIRSASASAQHLLGYDPQELEQRSWADLLVPEQRHEARDTMLGLLGGHARQSREMILTGRNGQHVPFDVNLRVLFCDGRPAGIEVVARDLRERHELEEHVRQAQKMEAIGVLAGGIAHDFNNLLTGILGYAYMLQSEPEIGDKAQEGLTVIIKSAERAAQLTTQLLSFARHRKKQNTPVDVHATIGELVELLARTIDKKIRIVTSLRADSATVLGDPGQIYQLLLNLCVNARDAMPAGGDLTISTRRHGGHLVLTVADTGTGIDPEIQARIFEPFFTTKPADKGTGMGLAMVYGIARHHGGSVNLDSRIGHGSAFHVTLPLSVQTGTEVAGRGELATGSGRILVIDDEEVVREVVSRMLLGLGYQVVTSGDSRHAVQYYAEHFAEIDAVILDMIMPTMSGRDCYLALRAINPDIRTVLSSGYSPDEHAADLVSDEDVEFLQKPFQPEQLAGVLLRALTKPVRAAR